MLSFLELDYVNHFEGYNWSFTDCWELVSRSSHHTQFSYFASSAQVKHCETYYADFLV